jgi:hypothetical protein
MAALLEALHRDNSQGGRARPNGNIWARSELILSLDFTSYNYWLERVQVVKLEVLIVMNISVFVF